MSYADFDYDFIPPKDRIELLKEGEASFRITQVVPKTSKAGNKMLEVQFMVRDLTGHEMPVYEYLIATPGDEAGMKRLNSKIGNIAKAIGKPEIDTPTYEKRKLTHDLLGHKGKCYIKVQEDKNGQYGPKNVISKYLPWVDPSSELAKREEFFASGGDDLPF